MANVYSMTGFARGTGRVGGRRVTVEVKSVNHRYLDLKLHLPRELTALEADIAGLLRERLNRGRVDIYFNLEPGEEPVGVAVNRPLAAGVIAALRDLKSEFSLAGEPELSLIAGIRDVIVIADSAPLGEDCWPELATLLGEVLQSLVAMRAKEGAVLAADLVLRVGRIEEWLEGIAVGSAETVGLYRDKLARRVKELMGDNGSVEAARLAQEVVLFADRSDISEELVRARSHLAQFRAVLGGDGPKGRKLDFLIQELFREFNTASNKAQNAGVSSLAVQVKTELEKVREQVQNLE